MKNLFVSALSILLMAALIAPISALASYSMPAIEVGFKWSSANQLASESNKQTLALQLGGSGVLNVTEKFGIKSGLFYSERSFKSEFGFGVTGEGKITYFEVPLHLMYKLEDYAGIYLGPSAAIKLGDEYKPGRLTEIKDFVVPLTFGAQFKFHPMMGINVFFEAVSGELARGVENSRAVGLNLMVMLD